MDARLGALAAQHHGLVTATDAEAAGVTRACVRWAVERGDLMRLATGVWCLRQVWDASDTRGRHVLRLRAAQHRRPRAVACAESAAVVLGLPLPVVPPDPRLTVARQPPRHGGSGRRGSARGRRAWLTDDEVVVVRGLRVTTPARTVVDLSRHVSFPWALAAGDAAMRFLGVDADMLRDATRRNPCAPGHPKSVLVARHADPRPESALESVTRGVMIKLALPVAEPQVVVQRYRVDLLVRECWTVVEADGKVKYNDNDPTAAERVWLDKRRRDDLHDCGHEVVRFVMDDQRAPIAWGRRCVRSFDRAYERRGLPTPDWGSRLPWL
ncbi:MAG: type IV toxin-antitoxin system AbiEi family antitoxin domain-containing protein [Actinomycetes bacterium]